MTWPNLKGSIQMVRSRKCRKLMALAMAVFYGSHSSAAELKVEVVELPPLRILAQPARAHTQGLELVEGQYYVTARRDDLTPKRALLLRTGPAKTDWDIWDITPERSPGAGVEFDHPGGMQSDGTRLWIPLAESKRNGRSLVCAFSLAGMKARSQLKPVVAFPVNDHIGALAVSAERGELLGANWDTEKIYVWDLKGNQQRVLNGSEMKERELGVVTGPDGRAGVTVQDWKVVGNRLFASGLFRSSQSTSVSPASRLCWFEHFLERDFRRWVVPLSHRDDIELANEAMAIAVGRVYFLPEDLGASNRLFRVSLPELTKLNDTP